MNNDRTARALFLRVWNTAVFWTWMVNGLRLAAGVLILPILWRVLSKTDLGMYGQFYNLMGFAIALDLMFATTIMRHVGYAMRGIGDIQSLGLPDTVALSEKPNYVLLGQLFCTTKLLYRVICLVILVLFGTIGTLVIYPLAKQTSNPTITWIAWATTILSSCLELYTGYWLVFLRGMNQILLSSRLSAVIYGAKLLLSVLLLLAGMGLLAVPFATLLTGVTQRLIARRFIKDSIPEEFRKDHTRDRELLARIWPTSWRMGLVSLSQYVLLLGFGAMITEMLGGEVVYLYQFSYLVMFSVCSGMAGVWTYVKWPLVMQLRVANDFAGLQKTLWPRIWLQTLTYIALAVGAVIIGPPILKVIAPSKQLLPQFWLILLAIHALLENHYVFWTTLLTSENRIPSLWAAVVTNLGSLGFAYVLVKTTSLGIGGFVLAPLIAGLAFNYWYWPHAGARVLNAGWFRFISRRPRLAT